MRMSLYAIAIVAVALSGVIFANNGIRSNVEAASPTEVDLIDVDELQSKIDLDELPVAELADMI